ncbi:adenosylmethionine decarboxylase [Aliikangiella sp. IMCC44653]
MLKDFHCNSEIDPSVATDAHWPEYNNVNENDERNDHFVRRDGKTFAGTHIIIDLWGASRLDNLELMEKAFRQAVEQCGATLLHIHLHHFTPNGGISGVAVLAESHISVHTWPEADYAAFDVFMCGDAEPHKATEIFRKAFTPERIDVREILRGENIGE